MIPVPVEIAVHTVQGRCWDFRPRVPNLILQPKYCSHSVAMVNLTNLQTTLMVPAQFEQVYLKDSKCILFEILANRTWKGHTSSSWLSQPDLAIWLAWPAGASMALPCPIC